MTTRILTFHDKDVGSKGTRIGPTYYMEADYAKVAVRIHAEETPIKAAKIDILDDGVSIFNNRTALDINPTTGEIQSGPDATEAVLDAGASSDVSAEDFNNNIIAQGSWVYCNLVDAGSGKNFTVHLELERLSEDGELED